MKTFRQFVAEVSHVQVGPHGAGSWVHSDDTESEVVNHPTNKTVGNEPFKDKGYFRKPKIKKYVGGIRKSIAKKKNPVPPVLGTEHPADSSVHSVIDGNHRRQAAANARAPSIPVEKVPHDNVRLLHPDQAKGNPKKGAGVKLSSLRNRDGSYDMDKPRKKLGGLTIRHYFVNPDGSHKFGSSE